jgi:hypothetical protein
LLDLYPPTSLAPHSNGFSRVEVVLIIDSN